MNTFLLRCKVLDADMAVADNYGRVKALLLNKGRSIHENDTWIASIAIQHKLPLFISDKHFKEMDGLQLFNPLSSI